MNRRGMTLIELVAAAVVGAVVAGGTLMAFVTAIRITSQTSVTDAMFLLQQSVEKFRNQIACDNNNWFETLTCEMALPACAAADPDDPSCFTEDALPDDAGVPATIREWRANEEDCDDDGVVGDCMRFTVRMRAEAPLVP